ncbi:hypothetical protein ACFLS7_03850 [Bacteroidota bacterium]
MEKYLVIGCKWFLAGFLAMLFSTGNLFCQKTTFGDLIPEFYLPDSINSSDLLDCNKYFHLADSINARMFPISGINPIPESHCGNDLKSYYNKSIEDYVQGLSPGSILARMIIDRNGSPVCCKVYMRGSTPGKEIENALSKLIMTPCYRNGRPIPTECRFLYDFLSPRTSVRHTKD